MRKKLLVAVLAASMVLSAAPVLPVNTGTVASAEDVNETVGAEDKSAAWWTAFSKPFKLEQDKTLVVDLDNYGNTTNVWNNYVMIFTNDGTTVAAADAPAEHKEYAVVRADDWGWGGGDNKSLSGDAITYTHDWADDATFKEINEDAHVTLKLSRKGSWILVNADVVSNKDATKKYNRTATLNTGDGDVFLNFTVDGSYLKINSVDTQDIDPDLVIGPGTEDPGTEDPGTEDPGTEDPGTEDPGTEDPGTEDPAKTKIKVTKVTAKKNATKVTGTVSVTKATVKVKVGKKAYKKATVNGKKFTIKVAKLKKGTKITVKATKKNCTAATKSVTVK